MPAARVTSLDNHPNRDEIVEVLARMVTLTDEQISLLAVAWCDDDVTSAGRATALGPDSPLILEALAALTAWPTSTPTTCRARRRT